jgi:MSHA biogenesis protein MshO
MFIRAPVQGYVDSARRAELTDIADTALRRMARDIRSAVPNSVRVTGTSVEFIPTKDGGRYRADTPGNVLNFGVADGTLDVVGTAISFAAGDYIVVGSTQSNGSLPYDETATGVLRPYVSQSVAAGVQTITFTNAVGLPVSAELPSQRFDVVDGTQQAVTYSCAGTLDTLDANNDGQGSLVRHWQYWSGTGAAHAAYSSGGSSAMLANKISACTIDYGVVNQRFGLLAIRLTLTSGGESVTLYNEIHVNNAP